MGLLGTMARTAVVAGTATHVSNNVTRRQQARLARGQQPDRYADPVVAHQPPRVEPTAPASGSDLATDLQDLAALKAQGVLTDEEFAAAKRKLLGT